MTNAKSRQYSSHQPLSQLRLLTRGWVDAHVAFALQGMACLFRPGIPMPQVCLASCGTWLYFVLWPIMSSRRISLSHNPRSHAVKSFLDSAEVEVCKEIIPACIGADRHASHPVSIHIDALLHARSMHHEVVNVRHPPKESIDSVSGWCSRDGKVSRGICSSCGCGTSSTVEPDALGQCSSFDTVQQLAGVMS